jgi:hypothetical protein
MRVAVTARDEASAIDTPPGWTLIQRNGAQMLFERKGATSRDVLVWINLLERRQVLRLEFERLTDSG